MAEQSLRLNLERAFDAGPNFPDRLLLSRTMALLDSEVHKTKHTRVATRPTWLFPTVAALLALVMVGGLLLAGQRLHSRSMVPATNSPTPHTLQPRIPGIVGGVTCDTYEPAIVYENPGAGDIGSPGPAIAKAVDQSTIWAKGGLRSTDGGANWRNVAPASLRADEPAGLPASYLPPDFVDFYLDGNNAWIARSFNYGSPTYCYDHVAVFRTSDGGRNWQESTPIAAQPIRGSSGLSLSIHFVNSHAGWLLASSQLFQTVNGGRDWKLVPTVHALDLSGGYAPHPSQECVNFVSSREAWCASGQWLSVTFDSGKTWQSDVLRPCGPLAPVPDVANACLFDNPVFFSPTYGVVRAREQRSGHEFLYLTSDGGRSWRMMPAIPSANGPYFSEMVFTDAVNFWDLISPPGWSRGSGIPARDWLYHSGDGGNTWTLVQRDTPIGLSSPMVFVDAVHGFALQQDAQDPATGAWDLLVTDDGGRSWRELEPQIS